MGQHRAGLPVKVPKLTTRPPNDFSGSAAVSTGEAPPRFLAYGMPVKVFQRRPTVEFIIGLAEGVISATQRDE